MFSKILRGAVMATFVVGATVAQADPSELDFNGMLYGESAKLWKVPTPGVIGGNGNSYLAGLFQGNFDPDGVGASLPEYATFFCIDLLQWADWSSRDYTRSFVVPSTTDEMQLRNLFASYGWPTTYSGAYTQNRYAAAMQLAVWNVLYDSDSDVTTYSGSGFYADADTATETLANQMMGAAISPDPIGTANLLNYEYTLLKYESSGYQDYIAFVRAPKDPPPELPLPGTLALLGLGLAGLGLARRKAAH